jgi:predicted nucleic acid-binding protein
MAPGDTDRIEQHCLIDTMVIIQALRCCHPTEPAVDEAALSCGHLLSNLKRVRISSVTYFELFRKVRPEERSALQELMTRLAVYDMDVGVSAKAAQLLQENNTRWSEDLCSSCRHPLGAAPCAICSRLVNWKTNWNDYLITATAIVQTIPVLYTADKVLLALADRLDGSLQIRHPPNRSGPLFSDAAKPSPPG